MSSGGGVQAANDQQVQSPVQTNVPPPSPAPKAPRAWTCETVDISGSQSFLCQKEKGLLEPYLIGAPGVVVALVGFWVVHKLSVQRQKRDEQFKMVQATRDQIQDITREALEIWASTRNRVPRASVLIQRFARLGRLIRQLQVRHKNLDVGALLTSFRRASTMNIETEKSTADRNAEIAVAAAELDEQIILQFLKKYG